MIVVADTTPIISLLKLHRLTLLQCLFQEVLIPEAVFEELTSNLNYQEEAKQIKTCDFIKKVTVEKTESVYLLRRATGLDKGESEAIIYTDETCAELLLIDEVKGRLVAKQMGLKIMGTLGILLEAYKEKLLSKEEVLSCIEDMKRYGRHISNALYEQLIKKLES